MWSGLVIIVGKLSVFDHRWLVGTALVVVCQYATDAVDGKVGIIRGAGLVKWGHYVDHFLDYVFMVCVLAGYGFMLPSQHIYIITWAIALVGGFMLSVFLSHGATGSVKLSVFGIGPFEIRLLLVGLNLVIAFGRASLLPLAPAALTGATAMLAVQVFRTQKALWALDQELSDLGEHPNPATDRQLKTGHHG
jgi:phosphatidylglycerophosphate synthase